MAKKTKPFISLAAPTGIQDVIAGGVRALQNSYNAWQPKPGDTSSVARVKGDGPKALGIVDQLMTGGMVGSFGNVIDPRLGQSLQSRDAAQKQANIQLLKDAGINAAGAAVGYGIGKGVQQGVKALDEAGLVNRALNFVRGDRIITHGTPTKGLTNLIPQSPRDQAVEGASVFGWNTSTKGDYTSALENPKMYAGGSGEVLVGKARKATTKLQHPELESVLRSSEAVRVLDRVPIGPNYEERMIAALRKAGVKAQPNPAERALIKAEKAVASKKMERQNKRSPV